jgi:hypothetical protein
MAETAEMDVTVGTGVGSGRDDDSSIAVGTLVRKYSVSAVRIMCNITPLDV